MSEKNLSVINVSPQEWAENPLAPGGLEHTWRLARLFADSDLIPTHFRGKPNNIMIAVNLSARMGLDAFMVMQHLYVLHGKPGIEGQLVIALVNQSGLFTPLNWRFEADGQNKACTCFATHIPTGDQFEYRLDWATVEAEGWNKKSGSKWQTMPDHMLRYRSAAYFARMYCPQLIMGMHTVQELRDMPENEQIPDAGITLLKEKNVDSETPATFKKPATERPDNNPETAFDQLIRDWHDLSDLVPDLVIESAKNMRISSNPIEKAEKQALILAVCHGMIAAKHEFEGRAAEILGHYEDSEPF